MQYVFGSMILTIGCLVVFYVVKVKGMHTRTNPGRTTPAASGTEHLVSESFLAEYIDTVLLATEVGMRKKFGAELKYYDEKLSKHLIKRGFYGFALFNKPMNPCNASMVHFYSEEDRPLALVKLTMPGLEMKGKHSGGKAALVHRAIECQASEAVFEFKLALPPEKSEPIDLLELAVKELVGGSCTGVRGAWWQFWIEGTKEENTKLLLSLLRDYLIKYTKEEFRIAFESLLRARTPDVMDINMGVGPR